jgi:putative endonuclease
MHYVYFIKSDIKDFLYVGMTNNIQRRLSEHNNGEVQSTKHYKPLHLEGYVAVKTENHARELELYFKTGSGKAVLLKRFISSKNNI